MSITACLCLTVLLLGAEVLYLKLARQFRIFDVPNNRSLHQNLTTVRGAGIIVYLAVLSTVLVGSIDLQPYFFIGLTAVALVSFADDLYGIPASYRIGAQLLAVSLLLLPAGIFPAEGWGLFFVLLLAGVFVMNTWNFMDGINGMTAFSGLVTVGTLWGLQQRTAEENVYGLYPSVGIALLIFSYFNARPRAICFAGDVGSIAVGFIVVHGLLTILYERHTYLPLLLLTVYGIDCSMTLLQRLGKGQNIFQAHRVHLFQLLVYKQGWPHLRVAVLYAALQAGINGLVWWAMDWPAEYQTVLAVLVLSSLTLLYVGVKSRLISQ